MTSHRYSTTYGTCGQLLRETCGADSPPDDPSKPVQKDSACPAAPLTPLWGRDAITGCRGRVSGNIRMAYHTIHISDHVKATSRLLLIVLSQTLSYAMPLAS